MSNRAWGSTTARFREIWIKIFGKKANAIFWKSHSNLHFEIQSIIQEGHEILKENKKQNDSKLSPGHAQEQLVNGR